MVLQLGVSLLVYIKGSGDIEEVKSKTIDNTTEYKQYHTRETGVTGTKQTET